MCGAFVTIWPLHICACLVYASAMDIKPHITRLAETMTIEQIATAAGVNRATVIRAKSGANITVASFNKLLSVKAPARRGRKRVAA